MQTVCDNMEINCSQKFTLTIHIQSPGRIILETEITPQILMLLLQDSDLCGVIMWCSATFLLHPVESSLLLQTDSDCCSKLDHDYFLNGNLWNWLMTAE